MHLLREFILMLLAGFSAWPLALALGLPGGVWSVVPGLAFSLPFQAVYALAALAAKRAPAWVLALLGALGWLGSFWPVLSRGTWLAVKAGLPGISRIALPVAAAPLLLALLALLLLQRRQAREGAAADRGADAVRGAESTQEPVAAGGAAGGMVAAGWATPIRGAAAALFLWSVPYLVVRWTLVRLMPVRSEPVLQILAGVGAVYLTLRLMTAVAAPLPVDRHFRGEGPRVQGAA